jgi:aryl-phospho-beta-D-glucosidase BglC (GH1 family)
LSVRSESLPTSEFKMGVNFNQWFEATGFQQIDFNKYKKKDFLNLKKMNGGIVRLPINFEAMTSGSPNYTINNNFFAYLDSAVNWAEELNMYLIIDNHTFYQDPRIYNVIEDRLNKMWNQISLRYKDRSNYILYETCNEPREVSDSLWGSIQQHVINTIRSNDNKHTIIVTAANWSNYANLTYLPVYTDNNLIYTFHFYDPMVFTHQNASFINPATNSLRNIPFPYNPSRMPSFPNDLLGTSFETQYNNYNQLGTVDHIRQLLDIAINFKKTRHVRVFCGELGVHIPGAQNYDRVQWYNTVCSYLTQNNIPFTMWDYKDVFGLYEYPKKSFPYDLNTQLLSAIGLSNMDTKIDVRLDFEDKNRTLGIIDHLHTTDWQTNTAYTRDLFASNQDTTGTNKTLKCAIFSGYNSDNEYWYGYDFVLNEPIPLTSGTKYVHAMMKTNNTGVNLNRGLIILNSSWTESQSLWQPITGEWADYVFQVPSGFSDIKELRFMLNHKATGEITYLDEIVINNDPNPRTGVLATLTTNSITSIVAKSAISGGNISSDGGASINARGICWSTSQNPTIADNKTNNGTGVGQFTCTLTGLQPNTTYCARTYASNSAGTAYGNQVTFTTLASVALIDFENENETWGIIDNLHTTDWQTDPAYTRDVYASNPGKTKLNQTERCASFSGYSSLDDTWYGLDIVLKNPVSLTTGTKYVHAMMKTNNTNVDLNRGLIIVNSAWTESVELWQPITSEWSDYVFQVPIGFTDIKELRFMLNHRVSGEITYLDEIVVNNNPYPIIDIIGFKNNINNIIGLSNDNLTIKEIDKGIIVYSGRKVINVISPSDNFDVKVYNILGILIFSKSISGNQITIPINENGIYIVSSKQFVKKVWVY